MRKGFDVVVVGGGTAGCVLAARMSADQGVTVLLVEAGPAAGPAEMSVVPAWPALLGSAVDWGYHTSAQPGLDGAEVFYPRGKVLGGSSGINAMAHLRGHRCDYDGWAADGAIAWAYDDLLPYFRRSEDAPGRDPRLRGVGGPMRVATASSRHPLAQAGLDAVVESGYPLSDDLNGADQEGGAWLEMNAVDGTRQSAYDGYLAPVSDRPNLRVVTGAHVCSLRVNGGRCVGVTFVHDGREHEVDAGQVVLCAGAIGSPQVLMLSGIGPAADLERLGIEVVLDVPAVGRDLQDHPLTGVVYAASGELPAGVNNHAESVAMLRTDAALSQPDVQLLFMDIPFHPPTLPSPAIGYTIGFAQLQPRSRGSVTLVSPDPFAAPRIDVGFYTDDRDLDTMVAALRLARRLGNTEAMARWRGTEALPGPDIEDTEALRAYLRRSTGTYFHPVGTCRLGSDAHAVVDTELRVNGIDGLRIADASVMPSVVSANTNATVLAIAERAAEWLRG